MGKPTVTGTTHELSFNKLSPRDFERLCLWLVKREGYERAEHLGAAGSEQGRDIIAWRGGELWAFQCKRVQRFGPKDALAEVEKVLTLPEDECPSGLVFLVTCDVSATARQQARDRCVGKMECHFWTGTELDEKVKRYSDILKEFFLPLVKVGPWVFDISSSVLKRVTIAEVISIISAILSLVISQSVVPLTASFDQVILYAVICAGVLAIPCHLLSQCLRNHVHVRLATFGGIGLLILFWSLVKLATLF